MSDIPDDKVLVDRDSVEALAENIQSIAVNMRAALGPGGLTEGALIALIKAKTRISQNEVQRVLWALQTIDDFVTPKRKPRTPPPPPSTPPCAAKPTPCSM